MSIAFQHLTSISITHNTMNMSYIILFYLAAVQLFQYNIK